MILQLVPSNPNCYICKEGLSSDFAELTSCVYKSVWTICLDCFEQNTKYLPLSSADLDVICSLCKFGLADSFYYYLCIINNHSVQKRFWMHDYCCHVAVYSPSI